MRYEFLKPGQLHIAKVPTIISTVLVSCVVVAMFGRRLAWRGCVTPSCRTCREIDDCHVQCDRRWENI